MGKLVGKGGSVAFTVGAEGYAANVKSWTIDYVGDIIDTTDFTDGASSQRSFLAGVKSWSGSYEAILDDTTKLVAPGAAATEATFTIGGSRTLKGYIIITSIGTSIVTDGEATVSISFQGTAGLTIG